MDREKVIKQLENDAIATDTGYVEVPLWLFSEILALMKEQEPVGIEMEGGGSTWWYVCEECHGAVDQSDRYCKHCGRPFRKAK